MIYNRYVALLFLLVLAFGAAMFIYEPACETRPASATYPCRHSMARTVVRSHVAFCLCPGDSIEVIE